MGTTPAEPTTPCPSVPRRADNQGQQECQQTLTRAGATTNLCRSAALWTPYGDIARLEHLLDEYAP